MDKALLAQAELFRHIEETRLNQLVLRLRWQRYDQGETVIDQDDQGTELYVVVDGSVRVTLFSAKGHEVSFRDMARGQSFGLLSAIDGKARSASVVAMAPTQLAIVPAHLFFEELQHSPEMLKSTLLHLSDLIRQLSERVFEFSTLVARNRVQAELLRLAISMPRAADGSAVIEPAPTHLEIANRVSTQRETVSRELGALAKAGLISKCRGGLIVKDVERLAEMVEDATGSETA